MDIAHFHRHTPLKYQSIYTYFEDVRRHLPSTCNAIVKECPSGKTSGILRNMHYARKNALAVNHITGDVHYLAICLPQNRTLLTIHDCVFLTHPSRFKRWILKKLWLDLPVSKARFITAVSEKTKSEIIRLTGCSSEKITVVHTTVREHFVFTPYSFDPTKLRLLCIGTAPNKNLSRTIQALESIPCELTVIGNLNTEHKELAQKFGVSVRSLAHISDSEMIECYRNCHALLFASTLEGFGMPIIEANRVGRPVITSNISSMPEIAGDAALLVNPFEVSSIRNAVLQVLQCESLRENLIDRGIRNALRFNVNTAAQQYAQLYERIYSEAADSSSL